MALTLVRVQFTKGQSGAYRSNEIAYFTPGAARTLVAAGHTALDPIPANTPAPVPGSLRHAARVARESEIITSETDRQAVNNEAAPVD